MKNTRRITTLALLTTVSLVLFVAEAQIPPLTPLPGIKLGLANIVTLFILHNNMNKPADAVIVVIARVLLAGFVTGSLFTLMFSLSGGLAAVIVMLLFKKLLGGSLIHVTSVAGAVAHNLTQISIAAYISSAAIFLYLPALMLGAVLTGLLTGFTMIIILKHFKYER
jgi:heptaprenyl diphosphate synthase